MSLVSHQLSFKLDRNLQEATEVVHATKSSCLEINIVAKPSPQHMYGLGIHTCIVPHAEHVETAQSVFVTACDSGKHVQCVDDIEEVASSSLFSFPTMTLDCPQLMDVVTRSLPFTNEMCSYQSAHAFCRLPQFLQYVFLKSRQPAVLYFAAKSTHGSRVHKLVYFTCKPIIYTHTHIHTYIHTYIHTSTISD